MAQSFHKHWRGNPAFIKNWKLTNIYMHKDLTHQSQVEFRIFLSYYSRQMCYRWVGRTAPPPQYPMQVAWLHIISDIHFVQCHKCRGRPMHYACTGTAVHWAVACTHVGTPSISITHTTIHLTMDYRWDKCPIPLNRCLQLINGGGPRVVIKNNM